MNILKIIGRSRRSRITVVVVYVDISQQDRRSKELIEDPRITVTTAYYRSVVRSPFPRQGVPGYSYTFLSSKRYLRCDSMRSIIIIHTSYSSRSSNSSIDDCSSCCSCCTCCWGGPHRITDLEKDLAASWFLRKQAQKLTKNETKAFLGYD